MKNKYRFTIVVFICLTGNVIAQAPDWLWANGMQDPGGSSGGQGYALVHDALGNIYTTGEFDGTIDFDPGAGVFLLTGGGAFVTKLDSLGNFIWAIAMTGMCGGRSIAIDDSCNLYVAGGFNDSVDFDPGPSTYNLTPVGWTDAFFAKFDSSGNFNWANRIGGIDFDYCTTILIGKGEGERAEVYIAGGFANATIDFDPGPGTYFLTSTGNYCMYLSKYNSAGNFIWAKAGGGYNSWINDVAFDPSGTGDIYITGGFSFTVDFDMGAGVYNMTAFGSTIWLSYSDIFISRLDSMGNFIWAKQMGGLNFDDARSLAVNSSGDIYTTGYFMDTADFDPGAGNFDIISHGGQDIFISKLDNSGNFTWTKAIGGIDFDASGSLALDLTGDENIYTTGTFTDTVDFDPGAGVFNLYSDIFGDIYVAKLDSAGNLVWVITAGCEMIEGSACIVVDASDNAYITGGFYGDTCTFGQDTIINTGTNNEIYIARLGVALSTGINEASTYGTNEIVNEFQIQIFPNPASGSAVITFSVPQSGNVVARVVDVNGRLVATLADEEFTQGNQRIEWNAAHVEPGIYFLQFESANYSANRKLIVAK